MGTVEGFLSSMVLAGDDLAWVICAAPVGLAGHLISKCLGCYFFASAHSPLSLSHARTIGPISVRGLFHFSSLSSCVRFLTATQRSG